VLFVGLVLWIERGVAGRHLERALVALCAAVVLVLLPVDRYVNIFGMHDAMTLVPLFNLVTATSMDTLEAVYPTVVGVAAVVLAFAPRGWLRWTPHLHVLAFAGASVASSRFTVQQAQKQQTVFLGKRPNWVDRKSKGSVAYLYDGEPSWNGVWQTAFWNHRIDRVYDLGAVEVPGPLPQAHAEVQPDGRLFVPPSARQPGEYAVVSTWTKLVGDELKEIEQVGLTQAGLAVWRVEPPMRVRDQISGLQVNGDIYGTITARLAAYACHAGTFRLTLIPKQQETVEIRVNGRLVRRLEFDAAASSWHGDFPADGGGGECTLEVTPTGLLGTTVFRFDRS
jgi:hypothetical protein